MRDREHDTAPRGRHAPPLEVRQDRQRRRLYAAAGAIFAGVGYADATAEAIAREAGMSKATFYEHFDNKEDCIVALHDDATSAVDATKEHEIRAALTTVMEGRTTVVIAHRPATIALADRVAVLEGGRIVEEGTHRELLRNSVRYRTLLALGEAA